MNTHSVVNAASAGENAASPATFVDLKQMVSQTLQAAGHPNPEAWEARVPADLYASAPDDGHRMFLINRTWRLILGEQRDVDTTNVRYCLVDHAKVEDWIRVFTQGVAPWAVQHNLPLTKS